MLGTRDRSLLLEQLRPPAGYELSRAVGTTYTLDLASLLTAPLAFTYFNYHDEDGEPTRDPVALLEALRRHAEKITIYCQAGEIAVPKPDLTLLSYLEGSIVQVTAPRPGGIFHPKVWLLRFVAEDQPVRYRLICLSRNLTFDRAWDTCLSLEGELTERSRGFGRNRPLGAFVAALPEMAVHGAETALVREMKDLASEVRRVRFEQPRPFTDLRFHPLGLDGTTDWPFPQGARALVVSPFLTSWAVDRLRREQKLEVLVSRPESLQSLSRESLPHGNTFVLSPGAEMDAQVTAEEEESQVGYGDQDTDLAGIHAKIFLIEKYRNSHLFVGSANATTAAFQRNVELLVELVGGRWKAGIDALLGDEQDRKSQDGLRSLLQPWERPDKVEEEDESLRELQLELEGLRRRIAAAEMAAQVQNIDDEHYDLELRGRLPRLPNDASVRVWPATLPSGQAQSVSERHGIITRFEGVSFSALTAFWAFKIGLERDPQKLEERFVVAVPLEGAPDDRRERLLRALLNNRPQVLRLLLLLLSDEAPDVSQLVGSDGDDEGSAWGQLAGWEEPALLESMLQALSRDPGRVDEVARLIADLRKTPEGRELLPEGLEQIWDPVWTARKGLT